LKDSLNKNKQNSQFEDLLEDNSGKMPSMIHAQGNNDSSLFFHNSRSFVLNGLEEQHTTQIVDEYIDDEDCGFDLYEVEEKDFTKVCKKLAEKFNFPARVCLPDKKKGAHL